MTRALTADTKREIVRVASQAEHLGSTRAPRRAAASSLDVAATSRTQATTCSATISGLPKTPDGALAPSRTRRRFREGRETAPASERPDDGSPQRLDQSISERTDRSNRIDRRPRPRAGCLHRRERHGPSRNRIRRRIVRSRDQLPPARRCECLSLCPIHPHRRGNHTKGIPRLSANLPEVLRRLVRRRSNAARTPGGLIAQDAHGAPRW